MSLASMNVLAWSSITSVTSASSRRSASRTVSKRSWIARCSCQYTSLTATPPYTCGVPVPRPSIGSGR